MANSITAALWARTSTTEQRPENQTAELLRWAAARELAVAPGQVYVIEDSAWASGNGKGAEFDRQREALIDACRLGQVRVVLIWAIDRLSRKGIEDTLATMRRIYETGADIWSHEEPWLVTTDPLMRQLLVSFMAWIAQQESVRRSDRVKIGLARAEAEDPSFRRGRQPGAKDRKPRKRAGYVARYERARMS